MNKDDPCRNGDTMTKLEAEEARFRAEVDKVGPLAREAHRVAHELEEDFQRLQGRLANIKTRKAIWLAEKGQG